MWVASFDFFVVDFFFFFSIYLLLLLFLICLEAFIAANCMG